MADNPKGIRIQVYESDPLQWVFDLHPGAAECRQYRVSRKEWERLAKFKQDLKEIQDLLGAIARREEVEFEEAWEEEQQGQGQGRKTGG